jgi:hypothetical protein
MRQERYVTITSGTTDTNRDHGKRFLLVEMPAYDLEEFYMRALMALGTSGIAIPQDMVDAGAIGLALIGYQAFMGSDPSIVKPLKDEMMQKCVFSSPTDDVRMPWSPMLIEEVSTLRRLREEWLVLHTGFTLAALAQTVMEMGAAKKAAQDSLSRSTSTSLEQ